MLLLKLQSLKSAILFIYTCDRSTFTFKLKPHYVCFNLRPEGGKGHCHIWASDIFAVTSGRVFLSCSVWRVDKNQRILAYIGYHLWDVDQWYVNSEFLAYSKSGIEKWFIDMILLLKGRDSQRHTLPKIPWVPTPTLHKPLSQIQTHLQSIRFSPPSEIILY